MNRMKILDLPLQFSCYSCLAKIDKRVRNTFGISLNIARVYNNLSNTYIYLNEVI